VVREFRRFMVRKDLDYAWDSGTREVEIVSAELFGAGGEARQWYAPGDELTVQVDLRATVPVEEPVVSLAIHDQQNRLVYGTNSDWHGLAFPRLEGKHRVQFVLRALPFVEGKYYVTLGVHARDASRVYHLQEQRYSFVVVRGDHHPGTVHIPVECRAEPL
jgi:hypothetical protein